MQPKIKIENDPSMAALCVTILFIFCYGSPDLLDALIHFFMK